MIRPAMWKFALAMICGGVIWASSFAAAGAISGRAVTGAIVGASIGPFIGCAYAKKLVGPVVLWVTAFALLGAMVGPGADADACSSAVAGGAIGALLGYTGLRGLFMVIGALLGVNLGAPGGDTAGFVGLGVGALLGWYVGHELSRKVSAESDPVGTRPQGP